MKDTKKPKGILTIRRALRIFDFFGESFTFKYKDEEKHSSVLGGIVCICFYIIALVFFIYKFIPFYKRKIFSLQYYSIDDDNKIILFNESNSSFAFGLDDGTKNKNNPLYNLLDIKVHYIHKNPNKDSKPKIYHNCTPEDFLSDVRDKSSPFMQYYCLNRLDYGTYKGIYTDNDFSYLEITVESKDKNNSKLNQEINDYLITHDCKLQFYYTDVSIDISKSKDNVNYFLNSIFLQLDPTVIQKKNIFFMNYHLINDTRLLLRFDEIDEDKIEPKKIIGFSRVEDYSLYKGLNRTEIKDSDNSKDYGKYATIYIRADNKKTVIKRTYQDLMEFYADTSSLLLSIFWILGIIFAYYDRLKANHSISKRLFYFEGIKNNEFERLKKIKKFMERKEELEKNMRKNIENNVLIHVRENSNQTTNSNNKIMRNNFVRRDTDIRLKPNLEESKAKANELIDYSEYNIFEMIGSLNLFSKCRTKKFESKVNLFRQAKRMIDDRLDIIFYIRNMILFELIKTIYLESKHIIDFLSKPIISLKNNEESKNDSIDNDITMTKSIETIDEKGVEKIGEKMDKIEEKPDLQMWQYWEGGELYKAEYKLDSDKLSQDIEYLILNPEKTKKQNKLINLLKKHLKDC